ncbi:MAG: PilN domain-containing protein [Halieaceae bacterium]|nr:PilN domain-containing protein [Halieaceae bacterium]
MAQINLLPWRDARRTEQKREFLLVLVSLAALAVLLIIAVHLLFTDRLQYQQERNDYLGAGIASLDQELAEIHGLQDKRARLLQRMQVIRELQGGRPVIVHILDQLARSVPEGVFYTELAAAGQRIKISGVADDHQQVSSLMRRLDASDWFEAPGLEGMKAEPKYGEQATTFIMTVQLQPPPDAVLARIWRQPSAAAAGAISGPGE